MTHSIPIDSEPSSIESMAVVPLTSMEVGLDPQGINPTGSKTNEGHGFLHELVTNRIRPVKENQIMI